MIKIACAGFPIGQQKYQSNFPTVELTPMFIRSPRLGTLEKWRKEAASDFEFIVCASKAITHPSKHNAQKSRHQMPISSAFQDSAIVRQALQFALTSAEILHSRLIYFKLNPHFAPTSDNVKSLQDFFRPLGKGHTLFAWEPPASWPYSLVESLSDSLRLMPVTNPLKKNAKPYDSPMRYFRLGTNGKTDGLQRFTDDDLKKVQAACDLPLCYVVFNNGPTAYEDATRFRNLVPPAAR